jgi:hypothetical protein
MVPLHRFGWISFFPTIAFFTVVAVCSKVAAENSKASVRILDSQVVGLGNRTITYNRIEAPVLKPRPVLVELALEVPRQHVQSPEELAEIRRWESLRYEHLGGSATVIEGAGTEFRIWTPDGETVALSSIDFNFLQCLWDFEWNGVYYSVFFFAGGCSPEEFAGAKRSDSEWAAQFGEFPGEAAGMSRFTVVSAPKGEAGEKAIQALEDLHAFFDENRKQLRAACEECEMARIAHEEWAKAHPPLPKDTIVNFFPIRSVHVPKTVPVIEKARE